MEINALLPPELRLNAICWSAPQHLVAVMTQAHIEWTTAFFALEPRWLAGRTESAHESIDSYKSPEVLHRWFEARAQHHCNRFKLHFVTSLATPFDRHSEAEYAVVLEEFLETEDENLSRYYYLTAGAFFGHPPCVLHLLQILAIAHHHRVIMRRALVSEKGLSPLANGEGLIPLCLAKNRGTVVNADHEFWQHFSSDTPWLRELREACDSSLLAAGLHAVVGTIRRDRASYARPAAGS